MPRIDVLDAADIPIIDPIDECGEVTRGGVSLQVLVEIGDGPPDGKGISDAGPQDSLDLGHDESGPRAATGNVADDEPRPASSVGEVIVEVTPQDIGGNRRAGELDSAIDVIIPRQEVNCLPVSFCSTC